MTTPTLSLLPRVAAAAAALHLLLPGIAHASCGSAFCGVNTNWDAQGLWDRNWSV